MERIDIVRQYNSYNLTTFIIKIKRTKQSTNYKLPNYSRRPGMKWQIGNPPRPSSLFLYFTSSSFSILQFYFSFLSFLTSDSDLFSSLILSLSLFSSSPPIHPWFPSSSQSSFFFFFLTSSSLPPAHNKTSLPTSLQSPLLLTSTPRRLLHRLLPLHRLHSLRQLIPLPLRPATMS